MLQKNVLVITVLGGFVAVWAILLSMLATLNHMMLTKFKYQYTHFNTQSYPKAFEQGGPDQ
jgi:hypothetical protein